MALSPLLVLSTNRISLAETASASVAYRTLSNVDKAS